MLDNGVADQVRFECEGCGREQSLGALRRRLGRCAKCQGESWSMVTEYEEGERSHSLGAIVLRVLLRVEINTRNFEVVRLRTPRVPAEEAFAIASAWFWRRGKMAFAYMSLRRELDGEHERQLLRERGGRNCRICDAFFVPTPNKPWTHSGCCSKSCLAKAGNSLPLPAAGAPPVAPAAVAEDGMIPARCDQGHAFRVPPLYVGARRPCPQCGEKTLILAPGH